MYFHQEKEDRRDLFSDICGHRGALYKSLIFDLIHCYVLKKEKSQNVFHTRKFKTRLTFCCFFLVGNKKIWSKIYHSMQN